MRRSSRSIVTEHCRPKRGLAGRSLGLGLVELLVALAVGGIVLGIVASFFSFQSRVSRDTQARNELNIRARAVAEALIQDLRLAGARAVVDPTGRAVFVEGFDGDCAAFAQCVSVQPENLDDGDEFLGMTVWYASSLFLDEGEDNEWDRSQSCRRIDYRLGVDGSGGRVLYRSDVSCADPPTVTQVEQFEFEFAVDIESIAIQFVCGDGGPEATLDPARCYESGTLGFVREAQVEVLAVSPRSPRLGPEQVSLSATLVNMRSPTRFRE